MCLQRKLKMKESVPESCYPFLQRDSESVLVMVLLLILDLNLAFGEFRDCFGRGSCDGCQVVAPGVCGADLS